MNRTLLSLLFALLVAACGGSTMDTSVMTAARPVEIQTRGVSTPPTAAEYVIGLQDKLNVRVFQVADLSFDDLVVDTSGNIQMPLIGAVQAAGQTPPALSAEIARRLGAQFLRNPQVTVTVGEAASQKITIDGAVTKPGVYEMRGRTSLLQAVAMAEGPSGIADLSKVAVFRTIEGERSVAVFDLVAIRQGRADDPLVLGDDIVVVDTSRLNAALRNAVGALPALAIFRPF